MGKRKYTDFEIAESAVEARKKLSEEGIAVSGEVFYHAIRMIRKIDSHKNRDLILKVVNLLMDELLRQQDGENEKDAIIAELKTEVRDLKHRVGEMKEIRKLIEDIHSSVVE